MGINQVLPFASAVVIFVYALVVLRRYLSRGGIHHLLWGVGLIMYGIGSLTEAYYAVLGWNDLVFRLWYLFGAMLVAAWLGQGTVHLLMPGRQNALRTVALALFPSPIVALAAGGRSAELSMLSVTIILPVSAFLGLMLWRVGNRIRMAIPIAPITMAVLVLGSIYGAWQISLASLDPNLIPGASLSGHAITSGGARSLTPVFNIYGTLALVGGALYSAWVFWRQRILFWRMVGCVLIAAGALAPALGGTLSRFGLTEYLYLGEFLGATIMFIGFLLTIRQAAAAPRTAPAR